MISIQILAFILLIAHLISVGFIASVLYKQSKQFGKEIDFSLLPNLSKFEKRNIYRMRRVLFALALIILLGNLAPIVIDWITLISNNAIGRTPNIRPISIMYACSNAITAMLSAFMIWVLYKLAGIEPPHNDKK